MGTTTDTAKELVDQLADQQQVLAAAQAHHAKLMLEFSTTRRHLDQQRITNLRGDGADPRYTAGEFAALEIGLSITASKDFVSRTLGIARRLKDETPDAWDAWQAGHIDQPRAARINKALIRLKFDSSKQLLNVLVVDVAVCKTVELLGRWLNEFIARVEPDQTNERLRRSFEGRYVSIRPDIDGISFLNAAIASADADAINQVLNALAAIAEPGDTRTFQQRRADACTELLLGKISNGCHVSWQDDEQNDDEEDEDDDGSPENGSAAADSGLDATNDAATDTGAQQTPPQGKSTDTGADTTINCNNPADRTEPKDDTDSEYCTEAEDSTEPDYDRPWDTDDDFDLPASAFRPDPNAPAPDNDPSDTDPSGTDRARTAAAGTAAAGTTTGADERPNPYRKGRPVITPCPNDHHTKPIPATIGVIISAQSLFGYSNTPGQLTDRSSLILADLIRDLAQQPGTLFYRLLTDDNGNLLDVTIQIATDKNGQTRSLCKLRLTTSSQATPGRFPCRKTRQRHRLPGRHLHQPDLHHPAHKCDHDHVIPVPEGPTTAANLNNDCRPEHRAKTHAGHNTSRDGNVTTWKTPTGHTYTTMDQPFPVEQWPIEQKEPLDE